MNILQRLVEVGLFALLVVVTALGARLIVASDSKEGFLRLVQVSLGGWAVSVLFLFFIVIIAINRK